MLSETNNNGLSFNTKEEENEFLKTRVEFLGLSKRTENALKQVSIRTVGGIIRKSRSSLTAIRGLGQQGLTDIEGRLKTLFEFGDRMEKERQQDRLNNRPLAETLYVSQPVKIDPSLFSNKDDVVRTFTSYFNLKKEDILQHSRKKDGVGEIRDTIIYFLREYGDMSFPAIGRLLDRDHTTIMYSYTKIKNKINTDKDFETKFAILIDEAKNIKERKLYVEQTLIPHIVKMVDSEIPIKKRGRRFKEIPDRDTKVLELYREGLTLENIAKVIKVSRERIRQIVEKTIRQMAINDSISKGINIDADTLIEEEKKMRTVIQKGVTKKVEKPEKILRWSRYYLACKSCGTSIIPHVRNGLCEQCIGQFRGDRRENIITQHQNKCDACGVLRHTAMREFGRDLYIMKDQRVLCRKCFLQNSGKKLGSYKNYSWSRFYENCVSCGTTSTPHHKKGFCEKCSVFMSEAKREIIIFKHNNKCDYCGSGRREVLSKTGRDLHITKDGHVSCQKCFLARKFSRQFS